MLKYDVMEFLSRTDKSWRGKELIPVTVVTTEKVDGDGSFVKWKSRICARGDRQTLDEWVATSCPVVAHHTLMTLMNKIVSTPPG